jgi:hypothetical protein
VQGRCWQGIHVGYDAAQFADLPDHSVDVGPGRIGDGNRAPVTGRGADIPRDRFGQAVHGGDNLDLLLVNKTEAPGGFQLPGVQDGCAIA